VKALEFQGQRYISDFDGVGGFIATPEAYAAGHASFAHIGEGKVWRFRHVIGTVEDIKWLGDVPAPKHTNDALINMLFGDDWWGEFNA